MRNTRIIFNENSASVVKEEDSGGKNGTTKGLVRKDNKGTHAAIDTMINSDAIKEF